VDNYEDSCSLRYDAVPFGEWPPTFRGNLYFQGSRSLVLLVQLNPEMLTIRSFKTSGTVYSATQRHITEDLNHNKHRCDNLIPRSSI
jgi:hypothetical protein